MYMHAVYSILLWSLLWFRTHARTEQQLAPPQIVIRFDIGTMQTGTQRLEWFTCGLSLRSVYGFEHTRNTKTSSQ